MKISLLQIGNQKADPFPSKRKNSIQINTLTQFVNISMNINKKIVVCRQCGFFPDKTNQRQGGNFQIGNDSITWKCQVCNFESKFGKGQLIMLPQSNYLRVSASSVLSQENSCSRYNYLIVLQQCLPEDIAYKVPVNIASLEQHLKIDLNPLQSCDNLEKISEWLQLYRKKKAGLLKFEKKLKKAENCVYKDEYIVFLMLEYLKSQLKRLISLHDVVGVDVDIVIKVKGETFCFKIEGLELTFINPIAEDFILVYSIVNNTVPSWLKSFYTTQIDKYRGDISLRQKYQSILFSVNRQDEKESLFLKNNPELKFIQEVEQSLKAIKQMVISEEDLNKYFLYPCFEQSFSRFLEENSINPPSFKQSIDIFGCQRRSNVIRKCSLNSCSLILKSILLSNKQYNINVDEAAFKKIVLKEIQTTKPWKILKLLKLIAHLQLNGNKIVVFYIFDYAKIQLSKQQETLVQPKSYQDVLKEDVYPLERKKSVNVNPFAKKRKVQVVEIIEKKQKQVECDEYISL